jgi:hypothetical protein
MATNIGQTPPASGVYIDMTTGATQSGHTQFRNRIINGDMRIDQRNSGASTSLTFNTSSYFLDRFTTNSTSYTAGSATIQRVTDAPSGFINSYKITVGATPFSGGTTPYTWGVNQNIEAYNINDFQLGTANASPFVLSCWFKANNTGEYAITLIGYNVPTYSRYTTTFNITANTWTYVSKAIPSTGVLAGTWNSSNDIGLQVSIGCYGTGGNASALNIWGQGNINSATCFAWPTTANAFIQVTGVQLEKGTKATPFEFRPFAIELQLCMRYFQYVTNWHGIVDYSTAIGINAQFIVPLRTSPSTVDKISGSTLNFRSANADNSTTTWTLYAPTGTTTSVWFQANTISGVTLPTAGSYIHYRHGIATSIATVNAEL